MELVSASPQGAEQWVGGGVSSCGDGKPGGPTSCPDSHCPWWLLAGIQSPEGHLAGGSYPKTQMPSTASAGPQAQKGVSQGRGAGGSFSEQAAGIKSGRRPLPQNHSKKGVSAALIFGVG